MNNTTGQSIPSQAEINEAFERIEAHFAEADATLEHLTITIARAAEALKASKALAAKVDFDGDKDIPADQTDAYRAHVAEGSSDLEHLSKTIKRAAEALKASKPAATQAGIAASLVEADMLEAIHEEGLAEALWQDLRRDLD
jgi:predicted  nucleic acid-binding Zn-ribbon protein